MGFTVCTVNDSLCPYTLDSSEEKLVISCDITVEGQMNEKTNENIIPSKINIHLGNWFICLSKMKTLVIGYNGCTSANIPHFREQENRPAWLESVFPQLQTELGRLMEMS